MNPRTLTLALASMLTLSAAAQFRTSTKPKANNTEISRNLFNHLDLGLNIASTGIGVDLKMPVTDWVDIRAGFSYMPRLEFNSNYSLVGGAIETRYDKNGNLVVTNFDKRSAFIKDLTGYDVDDKVKMTKKLTMWNFKFLVDIKPFRGYRNFHVTTGFYAGPNKVAKAFNTAEEAPSMIAVGMYNSLYKKVCNEQPLFTTNELPSIELDATYSQILVQNGMMGALLGTFPDGDQAIVVPDNDGVLKSELRAGWKVRPYLGVGWSKQFGRDKSFGLDIDAGLFFWGGTPQMLVDNVYKVNYNKNHYDLGAWQWQNTTTGDIKVTYPLSSRPTATEGRYVRLADADGNPINIQAQSQTVDVLQDLSSTRSEIGNIVSLAKKMKVYPVISITFSKRLF